MFQNIRAKTSELNIDANNLKQFEYTNFLTLITMLVQTLQSRIGLSDSCLCGFLKSLQYFTKDSSLDIFE